MDAPAGRVQVRTWPAAEQPAGTVPMTRPVPRVSTSTSSAVVAALATVTVSVYSSVSPTVTAVPSPTSTVLSTVIVGSTGLWVVHVTHVPLPGTTLLPTEGSASAPTVAVEAGVCVPIGLPAGRGQVSTWPVAEQPAGTAPMARPVPRVSTSTSSAVVAALATVTVSVYSSVSPTDTAVPLAGATDLSTVIEGRSGLSVVHAPQVPLPGTTL